MVSSGLLRRVAQTSNLTSTEETKCISTIQGGRKTKEKKIKAGSEYEMIDIGFVTKQPTDALI
jgi:hypothetical protein